MWRIKMRNFIVFFLCLTQCVLNEPTSVSGVTQKQAHVVPGSDGLTTEQRNIKKRYEQDNLPGSVQHLYVISAYSGQVILYSTVQGKVTSSGKRLTPSHIYAEGVIHAPTFQVGDNAYRTDEMIGDDGTYGSSIEYLYWYDVHGKYHQHYVSGGQIIHVSTEPLSVPDIIINLEVTSTKP
jgi:hypothetical protein